LNDLPGDSIASLALTRRRQVVVDSFRFLPHLAPGLRRLYLGFTELSDEILPFVARLEGLVYLQTWRNRFSDEGIQQLSRLRQLEQLYLEESSLTGAAFEVALALPNLKRLGLMDVPITAEELDTLRRQLPNVRVG
jgi:hypothetical protein